MYKDFYSSGWEPVRVPAQMITDLLQRHFPKQKQPWYQPEAEKRAELKLLDNNTSEPLYTHFEVEKNKGPNPSGARAKVVLTLIRRRPPTGDLVLRKGYPFKSLVDGRVFLLRDYFRVCVEAAKDDYRVRGHLRSYVWADAEHVGEGFNVPVHTICIFDEPQDAFDEVFNLEPAHGGAEPQVITVE